MVLPGCASSEPRYMMLCQFVVLAALVLIGQLGTDAIKINASSFQLPSPPFLSGGLQTNNILLDAERVHDGKIDIPHSYVILNDDVYAATEDGLVMNVAPCSPKVIATLRPRGCLIPKECGHPISIRRSADNLLLVLDAYRGVFEIHPTTGSIRHIYDTNTVVNGRASVYLNDMVLMDDGTIIMSDPGPTFDYNNEFWIRFEGKPDGRLLGYNPVNGQVKEILSGLAYPTGLELTDDRQALLVAEAARARIIRMDLSKNKFFERSFLNINLPGMPEHIRSSGRGTYWVGLAYPRYQGEVSILDQYANRPASRNYLAMRRTEDQLKLMYTRQGLAVEVDGTGRIVANLRDPTGLKVVDVTEVVEYGGIVYVGTKAQPAVVRAVRSAAGLTVDSVIQVMRGRCQLAENQVQEAKTALQQRMRSGEVTEATRGDALYETLVPPKGGDSFFSEFSFKTEAITQTQAPASSAQGAPNAAVLKNIRQGLSQLHKTLQNAPPAQSPPAYQNRHGYQANQPGYPHPPQHNQGYRQPPQGQRPYQQQVPPYRPHNGPGSPPQQQQPPNQHTQNNMNMPPQEQADPFISNPPRSPAPLRPRPGVWNQLPSQQSYPHQPPPQPSYPHQPPPQPSYPHQPPPQPSYPHQPPPQPSYPHQPPPQPSYPHQPPPQPSYPHQPPQQESYPHQPPQQESYPQQPVQQAYNQPLNRPKDKNRPHVVHKVLNGELISHVVIGEEAATLNFKPKEKPTTTTTTTTTTPPPLPLFPDLNPNQHSPPSPGTQIHFNIPSAPSQNGGTQSGMGGSVKEQQASPQPTTKYQRQDFNLTDMEALGLGGFFGFLQESQAAESKQAQQVNPEVAIASPDQGTYKNAPSNPPSDHQMNLEQFLGSMGMQNTESLSSPQTPSTSSGAAQKPPPSNNQDILKKSAADIQNLQMLHPTGGVESLPNAKNQAVPKAELAFDEARTAFIKQGLRQLQELFRQTKPTRPPTVATDTENAPPPQSVQNANPPVRRRTFPVTTPRPPRASAQSQSVSAPDPTRAIQSSPSLGSDTSSSQSNPPSATREVSQTSPSGSGSQSQRSGQGTPTGRQVGDVQPTPPASAWTTMSGEPLTPGNAPSSQSTYSLTVGDQTSPGETSMSGAATIHPNQPSNNVFGKGSQSDEPIGLEEQFFWHDAVSPSGPSEESGQTQNTNVLPTSQPMDASQGQLSSPPNPSQQGSNGQQPSPVITPPVTPTMSTEIGETPPPQGFIQIQQGPGQYIMIPLNQATLLQALSSIPLSQIHNAKSVPVQESDVSPKQQNQQQQGPQQQLPRQTDNQQYMHQTGQSQPVPQIRDQSPQQQLPQQGLQQQQQQYPQQGQAQFPQQQQQLPQQGLQQQQQQYPQQGQNQFPQQQQQQYPQQGQTQFPQQQQQQYPQQGQNQFPQQQQQQYPQQGQTQFPQQQQQQYPQQGQALIPQKQQQQYMQQGQTQIPQQQQQQHLQQGQAQIPQQQQQQYPQQGQVQIPQQQQQQYPQQGQAQIPQQQQQQYLQQGQSQFPQQQQQQYPQQGQAQIPQQQQQQQPGYLSPQPPQNLQTQSPFQPNLNPRFQHQLTQNQPVQQQLPGNVSQSTPQQTVQPSWPSQSTGQGNHWPQTETYSVQWQASTPMTEEYKPQTPSAQGNWGQQFIAQPLPSPSPPTGGNQFSTQGNIPLRSATTELSHSTATSKPFTTDNFSRQTSFQPTTPPSYPVTTTQQQQQFTGGSSFQSSQGVTRNQQFTPTTMDMTQGNNPQFPTSLQPPTSMGMTQQFTGQNTFSSNPQQQFTTDNRPSPTTFSSGYQSSNLPSPQPTMPTGVNQQFTTQNTVPTTFDRNRGQQFTTGNIPPQNTFSSENAPTSPSSMSLQPTMSSGVTQQFTRQNTFSSTNVQTQPMVPQSPQPTMPTGVTQQFTGQSTFSSSSTQGANGNQQFTTVNSFPQNTFPNENESWPPQSTMHTGTTQQFTTSENANLYSPPPTAQSVVNTSQRDTTGNQFPSHMTVNPQQFTNGNTAPSIQPTSSSGIPTGTTQQFIPTNTYPTSAHTNTNQYTTQGVTSPGTSSGAQQQFTTQQNWSGTSTDSRQQFTTNDGSSPTTNSFVAQPSEQPLNMSTLDIEIQQNFDPNIEPSPNTSGGANESQLPPT